MNKSYNFLHVGLKYGLLIGGLTLAYQTLVWFTGLNIYLGALLVFYLYYPLGIFLGLRAYGARHSRFRFLPGLGVGILSSLVASLCIMVIMLFFLGVLGGGAPPPFAQQMIDGLLEQAAAGEDVS